MRDIRFEIAAQDMGGWVRVFLARGEPTGEVARFLSHNLTEWMRKRPQYRIRHIVPITSGGDTSELHAWYELCLFPDISPMADPDQPAPRTPYMNG